MSSWLHLVAALAVGGATACANTDDARGRVDVPDDRRPVPIPPALEAQGAGWTVSGAAELARTADARALGVDALDEVPDSSWFTNRNTARPLSPAAIRRGPGPQRPPRDGARWAIVGMKPTGFAIGFRARDAQGAEWMLKFDQRGHAEVETGADVVVQRLLFAAGYNVPDNDIVYVTRDAITIAPGTMIRDDDGERPLRADDVDRMLARAARERDGRLRALASRVLPGAPLGGIAPHGTHPGDANDQIPHEHRRDLRGLYSIAAWLNHTDVKPANTLAVWVPTRGDPARGHVVHYLLDFGKALGAMARIDRRPETGFAYYRAPNPLVDGFRDLVPAPWHGLGPFPPLRGLGWLESARFEPARWTPLQPWLPFDRADRFDRFWGARIVMSFTPAQIRAALQAARYTEPRTVAYLARVLRERQRKVGAAFFRDVAPIDRVRVRGGRLCVDDLWVRYALGGAPATYTATLVDAARPGWPRVGRADARGTVCFGALPRAPSPLVVEVRIARPGQDLPPTRIHVATAGAPRVIALERR